MYGARLAQTILVAHRDERSDLQAPDILVTRRDAARVLQQRQRLRRLAIPDQRLRFAQQVIGILRMGLEQGVVFDVRFATLALPRENARQQEARFIVMLLPQKLLPQQLLGLIEALAFHRGARFIEQTGSWQRGLCSAQGRRKQNATQDH